MTQNRVEKRVPHFWGDMGVLLPLSLHGIKSRFAAPALSSRILEAVNALGIGPGGLGGSPTALGAYIQEEPTHIAGLPVAVTVNCWAERKASIVFRKGEI